jgi:F0F1-type ATP synthase membrane subunit b/b'
MSPGVTTFLFELVNFLILALALGYFLFTPIRKALESRRAAQEKQIRDAKTTIAAAETAREQVSKERAELDKDRDRILKEAEAVAQKRADTILTEARDTAAKERAEAVRELASLSDAQLERLASASADAAAVVTEKLLIQLGSPGLQSQLVKTACQGLKAMDGLRGKVLVESATALDPESMTCLNAVMSHSGTVPEYRVRPEIGTGIRVETSQGVIDLTSAGLSTYAKRELENRLVDKVRKP